MKIMVISSAADAKRILTEGQASGFITFIYHEAHPSHELLRVKFLYIGSEVELEEKLHLLRSDMTAKDQLRT